MTDVRLTALNPADSQVYPVACNDKGELLLEATQASGNLDVQGDLSVTGIADFVGGVAEIQGQGYFVGTGFVSYKMASSSFAIHDDDVNWQYCVYYDGTTHIGGYITTIESPNDTPNIALRADGSALFTGPVTTSISVTAGGTDPATQPTVAALTGRNNSASNATIEVINSAPSSKLFLGFSDTGAQVVDIKNDGTATFASTTVQNAGESASLNPGYLYIQKNSPNAGIEIVDGGGSKVQIFGNGNATFAGTGIFRGNVAIQNTAGTSTRITLDNDGNGSFAGTITAANVNFRLAPGTAESMPAPLVDAGFSADQEIDLLAELIKLKIQIKDLNAFMEKSIQESSEIEQ